MNSIQADSIVKSALPQLSRPEQLVVLGISDLETNFGNWGSDPLLGAGSNNMGAITDPNYHQGDPASPNQFLHKDSRPNPAIPGAVITYTTAFRKYSTPEAGFRDVAATALKSNVEAAISSGSLYNVSATMYANHYYSGVKPTANQNIAAHAKRLIQCVSDIVKATGEPNPFIPIAQEPELKADPPFPSGLPQSPSLEASSILQPTLRFGSVGASVQSWQRILKTVVDGDFGPTTRRLTREWQAAHVLIDDGIVGPMTWKVALNGST